MTTFTDLAGVYGGAVSAGIKAGKLDLAYLYLPNCTAAAGVFTQNHFSAACVDYTRNVIASGEAKALIVNSGNANAVTGEEGQQNTERTAEIAAKHLGISPSSVAIASTGIIGVQMPMDKVEGGLSELLSTTEQKEGSAVAEAILTTDTVPKEYFGSATDGGVEFSVAGIAKGAGMIAPNMATMLSFLVTDADLSSEVLQSSLQNAVSRSFNMMSVDTDTSTNDMVLIFSTGEKKTTQEKFEELLTEACIDLAKQIATDGEGAETLIEVTVSGAATEGEAQQIAKAIVDSPLVKTAIHGADPNWGRVIMAIGKVPGVNVVPEKTSLSFQGVEVLSNGTPIQFDRDNLVDLLKSERVEISVELRVGEATATSWGCDLTKGYIDINTEYN